MLVLRVTRVSAALLACLLLPPLAAPTVDGRAATVRGSATAGPQLVPTATGTIRGALKSPFARRYTGVVFIDAIQGRAFDPSAQNPVMDQKSLRFEPHVLPVLVGSTIDFPNNDEVRHNVYTTDSSSCRFNLGTYPTSTVKHVTCDTPGVIVLLCNVHAEMSAYIVVTSTPYFALTDTRGEFVIPEVPAGEYTLTFWHERLESQKLDVVVKAGETTTREFTNLKRK